jgi:hypothetical protein
LSINETVSILLGFAFSGVFSSARPAGVTLSFAGAAARVGFSGSFGFDSLALAGGAF